jgi:hypothetical protein
MTIGLSFASANGTAKRGAPRLARLTQGFVALVVAVVFLMQTSRPLTADVSWLMTVAERMLAGQPLYVDILELNPPMCALLYLPSVGLGQLLHIAPEGIVVLSVLALALGAIWCSDRILTRSGLLESRNSWWSVSVLVFILLPGVDFAEREHFALLAVIPMLAALAVRAHGEAPAFWQRLIAGVGGGLAMAIKPHFALAILVPAIYAAAKARSWRPIVALENIVAGTVVLGFWAMVALLFPRFFTSMLPLAADMYAGDRIDMLLLLVQQLVWPFWGFVVVLLILYRGQVLGSYLATFLAGACGFFLAYLAQGKGFSYHLMPAFALAVEVFLLAFATRNAVASGWQRALPTLVALLLTGLSVVLTLPNSANRDAVVAMLRPFGPGLKLANITPQLETATPLERQIGATLINSGPFLWMALGAIRIENASTDPARIARARLVEVHERDVLRNDMLRDRPDIILSGADAFDWLGWAAADPVIAKLLTDYEVIGEVGKDSDRIAVRKRRDLTARN